MEEALTLIKVGLLTFLAVVSFCIDIFFIILRSVRLILQRRKEAGSQDLDFLEQVDEEIDKGAMFNVVQILQGLGLKTARQIFCLFSHCIDAKKHIQELQISHADTINELEKTRNMLVLQHKINKDYQTEVYVYIYETLFLQDKLM